MHAPKSLNKLCRSSERATLQRRKTQRRQRKVRTLRRKQDRNHIHRIMRDRRPNHHSPEGRALPLRIKHPRQNHQVQKISHVRKLHEIIQPRRRKPRKPRRRMYPAKVVIEQNEPPIEPSRKNRMHQSLQLFKKENVNRQRIPIPRELQNSILGTRSPPRQRQDSHRDPTVRCKITPSMRNISVEYRQQREYPTQVTKRHPLKRPASPPHIRRPASRGAPRRALCRGPKRFHSASHGSVGAGRRPAPTNRAATLHFHRAAFEASRGPAMLGISSWVFSQTRVCHPRSRAARANRRVGFTATPCPTASSICTSPKPSP